MNLENEETQLTKVEEINILEEGTWKCTAFTWTYNVHDQMGGCKFGVAVGVIRDV